MATFYNQATLTIGNRTLVSNRTEGEIVSRLTLNKIAASTDYGPGDNIVYAVTLVNNDNVAKNNITITDNLGSFTTPMGLEVVPLNYIDDSLLYYINGVLQPSPTANAGPPLIITGIEVPAGGNVTLLYETRANEYAPLGINAIINNTVTADGNDICEMLSDNANIPTRDEANISIAKAICPNAVTCGDEVNYTFIIQNMGNIPVAATDNLILADTFNPVLSNITVALNGEALTEGTSYSYNENTGEFTTIGGAIPVPAATFVRDTETGIVNTTPGVAILTITGTI